ncbi:hypothetical protein CTA2_2848, partial [Colletotrichum tanaceti]
QRYARLLSLLWRDKPQEHHQHQQHLPHQHQQQKQKQRLQQQQPSPFPLTAAATATATATAATAAAASPHDSDVDGLKAAAAVGPGFAPSSSTYPAATPVVAGMANPAAGAFGVESHAENQHHNQHQHGFGGMGSGLGHSTMSAFPPQSDVLCRGFSWRDLDDLGQFIGPADMSFSDPANLAVMGGSISLDDGTANDILWPGNDVAF